MIGCAVWLYNNVGFSHVIATYVHYYAPVQSFTTKSMMSKA